VTGSTPSSNTWTANGAQSCLTVRSDSLLEQRGFEPSVLFGLLPLLEKRPSPAVFGQNLPADRSESNSLIGFGTVPPLKLRAFRKRYEPQRGPVVRIPSAPPTSQCEPPVRFHGSVVWIHISAGKAGPGDCHDNATIKLDFWSDETGSSNLLRSSKEALRTAAIAARRQILE
jgi:hypothetical protein